MTDRKEPIDWWPIAIALIIVSMVALSAFENYMDYLRDLNNVQKVETNEGK